MLQFALTRQYRGAGGSAGLERGLLVLADGAQLLDEGMGLGAVALQTGGYTYFASLKDARSQAAGRPAAGNGFHTAVFSLDRRLVWKLWGRPAPLFTRLLEGFVTHGYMKLETMQTRLLALGARLARFVRLEADFQPVPAQGEATVTFRTTPWTVDVRVDAQWQKPRARLFVMNELSGVLFTEGLADGNPVPPPSGWQHLAGFRELHSPRLGLAFTLTEQVIPPKVTRTLFWGRELTEQFCWAGFESDLRCGGRALEGYRYQVSFRGTSGSETAGEVTGEAAGETVGKAVGETAGERQEEPACDSDGFC